MALGRYDDKDYSAIRGRWDLGLTDQLIESAALLIRFLFGMPSYCTRATPLLHFVDVTRFRHQVLDISV